jgi:hypothetical protein
MGEGFVEPVQGRYVLNNGKHDGFVFTDFQVLLVKKAKYGYVRIFFGNSYEQIRIVDETVIIFQTILFLFLFLFLLHAENLQPCSSRCSRCLCACVS